jgi:signal-transduction protein with cAMP-binding, CBS, and nucleotidyltransferase domain
MLDESIDHVPVVADGRVVGICTRTDLLKVRRRQLELERRQPVPWIEAASTRARRQPDRGVSA